MLLWYSESAPDDGVPIYRVDARGRPLSHARLWSSPTWFGPRASFVVDQDTVHLVVSGLREEDHGVYRCRVDFKDSPTRNSRIGLTVTVPPSQLLVTRLPHPQGGPSVPLESLPPLKEGDELSLACEAIGGRPRPSVVWLLGDVVVADSWEVGPRPDSVVSRLLIPALGRLHGLHGLRGRLVCRASNNPSAPPVDKELFLDVHLRPQSARIVGGGRSLLAGQSYDFQCRSLGSRPPADITWRWKGSNEALQGPVKRLAGSATESISVLTLTPRPEHDGRVIECVADNPVFTDSEVRDEWRLSVHYAPRVTATLGAKLNASNIKAGDDVYLECAVDARPAASAVTWAHNGEAVQSSLSAGVVVTERTLVLRRVSKLAAGDYACHASNAVGRAHSPALTLVVMCTYNAIYGVVNLLRFRF
ncbi:synaptogenesis protein syg-2-like [Thrips palmi]|uniref:Synaptogenesis protein syg-2-like n=1 Tax=Thrips palmi TaxID=161013 RepID=A0A6P8YP75_THRPL|nr:synaptogenesis protein syg-2-like [Thrips palmi]